MIFPIDVLPEVRSRMQEHSKVQHFQQTFNGKDCGEAIIKISESLIDFRVFLDRILESQGDTAHQNDKHNKSIEKWPGDKPMESNSHTEMRRKLKVSSEKV